MQIHCKTYGHWKNVLVCSMSCPHTERCKQFGRWRQEHSAELFQIVLEYILSHPHHEYEILFLPRSRQQEKKMKQYACVREGQVEILTEEDITTQTLQGTVFEQIFELGKEMEIQIRLVNKKTTSTDTPDNGIKKGKGRRKKAEDEASLSA